MPSFEGAGSYLGIGYEKAKGIPGPITSFFEFESETLKPKYDRKPNPNINPRRARQKGRLVGIDMKGAIKAAPDAESQARIRAHHQGKVVTTTLDGPNNVYQHVLSTLLPGDADPATYRRTLSGLVYRDDGKPMLGFGGVVETLSLAIKQRDYVEETHDIAFERYTRMRQPIADAANNVAFTGTMYGRGVRSDPTDTKAVWVKAVTGGACDGTAKVTGCVAVDKAAALLAFDNTKLMTPIFNQWFNITDENGDFLGADDNRNSVDGIFYSTATGTDVLTANDIWKIEASIPVVSPSYTAREVYDAAQCVLTIAGDSYVFHQATLKATKPKLGDTGIGSVFVLQHLNNGEWMWSVELDRNYVDTRFVDALESGATAEVLIQTTGAKIGTSVYRDSAQYRLASVQYDDAGTNVANANALQEKIVLTAFDNLSDPICEETRVNTLSAL